MQHLKNKSAGFYFALTIGLLSLIQLIVYLCGFLDPQWEPYFDRSVVILSALAAGLGILPCLVSAFSPVKAASHYGAGLCLLFGFLSFLMFNRYGYMYYSELFFGGIEFRLILSMYYGYLYSLICYIVIFALGIAACFMKHDKQEG